MLVARRLLAVGGAGSFVRLYPPADDSWVRSASNPILTASQAFEGSAVQEPTVILEGATWRMWYRGGGWGVSTGAIGYATSTDGLAWTKYGTDPVLGQGGSGISGNAWCPRVVKVDSTYYAYYWTGAWDATSAFRAATSSDGIDWTVATTSISKPSGATIWGNVEVWREGASSWKMLHDAMTDTWRVYLYTSSDGLTWSIANSGSPLDSLEVHTGGMYGGMRFSCRGDTLMPKPRGTDYELWYHATDAAATLPTDIYHATSSDLINWTVNPATPVLTHVGSGFEVDQVADPSIIVVGDTAYLYYDGDDNVGEVAKIGVATAPATY